MTKKIKTIFNSILVFFGITLPALVFAQTGSDGVSQGLSGSGIRTSFGSNGLTGSQSLTELIAHIVELLLLFAGAIAVVFVIIGGYQYITSNGNDEAAEKGRKTLTNAIIGVIVIVLSYTIIYVITNLVGNGNL